MCLYSFDLLFCIPAWNHEKIMPQIVIEALTWILEL